MDVTKKIRGENFKNINVGEQTLEQVNTLIREVAHDDDLKKNILNEGEFLVNGRIIKRSVSSLICKFSNKNYLRQKAILIIENRKFENFIMFCIVVNSIGMSCFDYIADNECNY